MGTTTNLLGLKGGNHFYLFFFFDVPNIYNIKYAILAI